jgi:hypothetical protein
VTSRIKREPAIDRLSWHDGQLLEWRFAPGAKAKNQVQIEFALYKEQIHARTRDRVVITCLGVRRFLASCDLPRLKEHAGPGNVIDGVHQEGVLRVFLTGGFLEVDARAFRVEITPSNGSKKQA